MFRNEHGNAEFAIQLVRDAKGMTHTPDKRYEDSVDIVRVYVLIIFLIDLSIPYMKA